MSSDRSEAGGSASALHGKVRAAGDALAKGLAEVVAQIPGRPRGPVSVARAIGVDKVVASRVLTAVGKRDAVAVLRHAPGPEPLRRFVRAAARHGVPAETADAATRAVEQFDQLIRVDLGDRRALDAILSAWLPESRAEFELRRKQSVFRAMSELRGCAATTHLSTVFFHPSADGEHIDVCWVCAWLDLQRLRPGAALKFATRRTAGGDQPRQPMTIDGRTVDGLEGLVLERYCSSPPPRINVRRSGDTMHYSLGDHGFGPGSGVDLAMAELTLGELVRYVTDTSRRRHAFVEVTIPARELVFDMVVHPDLLTGAEPSLFIYDTAFDGIADVNDPRRDPDRLDLIESIQRPTRGIGTLRLAEVPWYADLLSSTCQRLGWDGEQMVGHRCRIEYPLYGTQVVMAFGTQGRSH